MSYDPFGRLSSKSDGTQSLKVFYDNYDFMSNKPSLGYVQKAGYGNRADNVIGLQTGEIVSAEVGKELYSVCYYDKKGQLVQKRSENHLGGLDCYYYLYTYTGKVASMLHEHIVGSSKQEEIYSYVYDNADRLLQVTHQLNGGEKVILRQNVYDKLCRLSSQKVFGKENVSYEYNIREWPTSISSENYKETLSYYEGNYRMYGGNVTSMTWSVGNETLKRKYNFSYDGLYRLTLASYWEDNAASGHYNTRYTYDLMGNMLTLKRNGLQDGGTYGLIDDVSFAYKGNQLLNAEDKVEDPTYKDAWNFVDGASENVEYGYDKNGNMVKDLNKGILQITYNSLNLPTSLKMEGGKSICYVYDAQGKKLQASYVTTIPNSSMTLDYCDNMIYENGKLTQILVDGGYVSFVNGEPVYHYYLKDHLGSNRVAVNQATGEVEQVNHYYPFGGLMAESTGGSVQRYKYNGKELDRMHGLDWYDYGARWYDGMRFLAQDSKLEKYYAISPYAYCLNSPIRLFDNDGREPGDFFLSPDAAARDFGLFYNANSIRDNLEYASSIYMIRNDKGTLGYTYTVAAKGKEHESVPSKPLPGFYVVASIHSHGAYDSRYKDNEFSGTYLYRDGKEVRIESLKTSKKGDIGNANLDKINAYLVTPNGSLQKYDYKTGKIKLLSTDMPSDNKDPLRLNGQSALVNDNRLDIEKLLELYRKQMYKLENIFKR